MTAPRGSQSGAQSKPAEFFELEDKLEVHYRYSYGGISPFFRALIEDQRIMGTCCSSCGRTYCPPKTNCPECYQGTEWQPLEPTGTVLAAVYCYWTPADWEVRKYLELPYVYALVQLDGCTGCLNTAVLSTNPQLNYVKQGMRVRAVFRERREGKITDFYFVPEDEVV